MQQLWVVLKLLLFHAVQPCPTQQFNISSFGEAPYFPSLRSCALCAVQPAEYQQTLRKSFTLGGIGLHTGDYGACSARA